MTNTLNDDHKDFICRKLAQFIPHKQIAADILERYPEIELTPEELIHRIKYYSASPKAGKWQQRIQLYRDMLNSELTKHFAHTHTFKRMRALEKILEESLKPGLQKVLWYPDGRDDSGRLIYSHKEVHKIDSTAAIRALAMIGRELEQLGHAARRTSINGEDISGLTDEQLRQRIETKRKLTTELAAIELDDREQA